MTVWKINNWKTDDNNSNEKAIPMYFSFPGRLPIPDGSSFSSTFSFWNPDPQVPIDSVPVPPPASLPGELRECYYNIQDQSTCRVLTRNSTYQECCCTIGEGWGLRCQYSPCPSPGSGTLQHISTISWPVGYFLDVSLVKMTFRRHVLHKHDTNIL